MLRVPQYGGELSSRVKKREEMELLKGEKGAVWVRSGRLRKKGVSVC